MSTFYTNKINIQVNDTVRLVFMDERQGALPIDHGIIVLNVGEAVMSIPNARALRDLLVQYVKDEPAAETIQ
jgi:hypothetical protein